MDDPLSQLLIVAGVSGSLISRARLARPFGVASPDVGRSVFHTPRTGTCRIRTADAGPFVLRPGDIAVVSRGAAHDIYDAEGSGLTPIARFTRADVEGLPTLIDDGSPELDLLCGTFQFGEPAHTWLVGPLPELMVVRSQDDSGFVPATLALLDVELAGGGLGTRLVGDRLVEMLVIHVLRGWAEQQGAAARGWLAGLSDPQLARAIAAVHADPGAGWDLPGLARVAGLSRTRFIERFRTRVGLPPGEFVLGWRIAVARRALRDGAGVTEAAEQAGYASEASFTRAFKRVVGVSPGAWRKRTSRGSPHPANP
ncbi:MAG: AraC family transcriptional regulator [Myxococcota bacterium]